MTYLFVAPRYHTNQVWAVRALQEAGHDVHYFVLYTGKSEEHQDVQPIEIPMSRGGRLLVKLMQRKTDRMNAMRLIGLPHLRALWKAFRQINPDVVVARGPAMPLSLACMFFARLLGKKLVIYTQGYMVLSPPYKERLKSMCLGFFRAAWMTTIKSGRDDTLKPHPRMFYLPFVAPAIPHARSERPLDPSRISVLAIGKFEPRKNHLLLVEAMKEQLASGRYRLVLVGEVSTPAHEKQLEKVRHRVCELGLDEHVQIEVNQPYAKMPEFYQNADLFVLPSRAEPAAVSHVEAMSFGCPVIVSTTCGTKCYVIGGRNGYVFKSDDAESLRESILAITEKPGELTRMSSEAYAVTHENHSADSYLRGMDRILASLP